MSSRGMTRPLNEELTRELVRTVEGREFEAYDSEEERSEPVYTIVVEADTDEDAQLWLTNHLDPVLTKIRLISESAFLPHRIVRLDTDFRDDDYSRVAFEASLNYAVNDPISSVVWWHKGDA